MLINRTLLCTLNPDILTNKKYLGKMKCDVGIMIDCDVVEKMYGNKVGMSRY